MRAFFSWKKWAAAFLFMPVLIGLSSCEKENKNKGFEPSAALEQAFQEDFPTATEVAWVRYDVYAVASFKIPAKAEETKMTAWYTNTSSPELVQQQENIKGLDFLPEAVRNAFYASPYNQSDVWRVDEVEIHYRHYAGNQKTYKIELDAIQAGKPDVDLFYDETGALLKEEFDYDDDNGREWDDDDMPIDPSAYKQYVDFLQTRYPGYKIDDIERKNTKEYGILIKAELEKGSGPEKDELDVYLTTDLTWKASSREIDYRSLSQEIKNAVEQKYPSSKWEIEDDAKKWETSDKVLYSIEAELESAGMETEVTAFFNEDGSFYKEFKKFD